MPQERCRLYHNNGDGTFTDVSQKSGILAVEPGYGLTAVAADFDGDGWPDIYVACDTSPSLLFRNNHDGTFTERGLESGVALNEDGQRAGRHGPRHRRFRYRRHSRHSQDSLQRRHASVLYRNNGKGCFRDVTMRAGLGVETRFVGWGAGIVDLDNDGLPDLFFATGMVYPEVEANATRRALQNSERGVPQSGQRQIRGTARSGRSRRWRKSHSSRGLAFGDFDNDGDLDILIMN